MADTTTPVMDKVFKGILQYTTTQFNEIKRDNGFIYFVRDTDDVGDSTGKAEIYFGKRKYADVSQSSGDIFCGTF